ncbi:MAG TPA: hypothetical protein VH704_01055, partial [Casimicrobiaceae bacterium]|nr:hypothetical protein [Casimicrobiaceae bacterium]
DDKIRPTCTSAGDYLHDALGRRTISDHLSTSGGRRRRIRPPEEEPVDLLGIDCDRPEAVLAILAR